jgi:uncharacterized protein (TIGR03084 family)
MLEVAVDLQAEADELHGFLRELSDDEWAQTTPFKGWTTWDVVAHLHFFDRVSLLALRDGEAFAVRRKALIEAMGEGKTNQQLARAEYGALGNRELLDAWLPTCHEMAAQLGESDPKRRLPWFGPDMGVQMFTTARLMETWAHGQDVYDLRKTSREATDRIKHIAVLGVKTFGWTFVNRGLDVPGPPPYVRLTAPSGAIWEWNEPSETEKVEGAALDFCRVVTQGRNVRDTRLSVTGDVATRWMAIAQCFAGGAADPPKAGERAWDRDSKQGEQGR